MSSSPKSDLVDLLAQSFSATQALLNEIDLDLVVYEKPVWQVRDAIWHLAVWDQQVTKSIRAFLDGGQYAIPDFDEDTFNITTLQDGKIFSPDQLLKECTSARAAFQEVVNNIPDERCSSEFLYPWGDESGDVTVIVKYMVEHDEEHRAEITSAASR